jgi:proton-coupled amino acid transporter
MNNNNNNNDCKQDFEGPPHPMTTNHHTYVAGEEEGRLMAAALALGLEKGRLPTQQSWATRLLNDDTLTAARMHSVGFIGPDERVDEHGTLHHTVTLRRRRRPEPQTTAESLATLFQKPTVFDEEGFASSDSLKTQEEGSLEVEKVVDMVEGGSLASAAFGILKGTVGPAILYLPHGFYMSGYAIAIPAMIFATGMYVFNAYRLLECWKVESDRNHQVQTRLQEVQQALLQAPLANARPMYGAAKVEELSSFQPKLLTYPELAQRALGSYSLVVEVGIAMFQFGVCLTYLIFVPDNLHSAILTMTGTSVSKTILLWLMIVLEIPLAWIRDIRKLTPTNVLATFLIAMGLACVLGMAIWEGSRRVEPSGETVFELNAKSMLPWTDSWILFIGTSFFMMEGSITLLVPLQEAVYRPEDKTKFADVNKIVTWWIVVFYIVFSAISCAAFGNSIKTAMTASLKGNLGVVVQLFYSTAVILTFPLQAFPAMEVALRVSQQVLRGTPGMPNVEDDHFHNVFSTVIIVILGIIAACAMESLGNVVSILGAIFGIPLALVFPPLMHNALVKSSSRITKIVNYAVVVVGIFAMAAASFNTIVMWDKGAEN